MSWAQWLNSPGRQDRNCSAPRLWIDSCCYECCLPEHFALHCCDQSQVWAPITSSKAWLLEAHFLPRMRQNLKQNWLVIQKTPDSARQEANEKPSSPALRGIKRHSQLCLLEWKKSSTENQTTIYAKLQYWKTHTQKNTASPSTETVTQWNICTSSNSVLFTCGLLINIFLS